MPRPGQTRINIPMALSLPPDLIKEYDDLAGHGYGARSTLFRKMMAYYVGRIGNPSERAFEEERARRLTAEAKLRELKQAIERIGL